MKNGKLKNANERNHSELKLKPEPIAELDQGNWIVVPEKQGNKFIPNSYSFSRSPARISRIDGIDLRYTGRSSEIIHHRGGLSVRRVLKKLREEYRERKGHDVGNLNEYNKNLHEDRLHRRFIGEYFWKHSLMLVQFLGAKVSNLREEIDYLHLIYLGSQGKIKVSNMAGEYLNIEDCENLLLDAIGLGGPLRETFLNTGYKRGQNGCLEMKLNFLFDI